MKAYIALSRVRKANDILIADIMSPTLFKRGTRPSPTTLLQVLRNEMPCPDTETCKRLAQQDDRYFKSDDLSFFLQHMSTATTTASLLRSNFETNQGSRLC
eukprot:8317426-Karenia_brevis.AAC.1